MKFVPRLKNILMIGETSDWNMKVELDYRDVEIYKKRGYIVEATTSVITLLEELKISSSRK